MVKDVLSTDSLMVVALEDGRTISVPIGWYPRLAQGTPEERQNFQISGAGYGIHWPDLDEDIGVEGLLAGKKSTESRGSFVRWLKQRQLRQENLFESLMEAVKYCSLGQITQAIYEVGGQYRRNM